MIRNILLVAAREFRQIAGTRGFWLTLLILPLAIMAGPVIQKVMAKEQIERVMLIDRSGGAEAAAIRAAFDIEEQRMVLASLSRYVERHHLEAADPRAPWAEHGRWYGNDDVRRFQEAGGLPAALARIGKMAPSDLASFTAPKPAYLFVTPPASIAATPDAGLDTALQPLLRPKDHKSQALDYAVLIPADFGASPAVRLWANGQPRSAFVAGLQQVLTRDLRTRFLLTHGAAPDIAATAATIAPVLAVTAPPPGGGAREAMLVRSILPIVLAYLLMISLMLSGSWMLQSTVEERSNKLIEAVLACVSPEELMYGKLVGTVGVGLSMIAVWVGCALVGAFATHGVIADFVRPALAPLSSPGAVAAVIYFFVMGFITISLLFLAIGSMSDSMRDVQGYLTPVLLLIMLPISALVQGVLAGGTSIALEVLTWVPIWTPFAVLARLGIGIPAWEVIGTGLLLAAFTALEVVLLGRLFRASLLAAGSRPSLAVLLGRLRAA